MQYITVQQAAEKLSVNHKLIRKLIKEGKVRAAKLGRAIRVDEQSLESYAASQEIQPTGSAARKATAQAAKGGEYRYRYFPERK